MPKLPEFLRHEPRNLVEWQARYELTMRTRAGWIRASQCLDPLIAFLGAKRRPEDVFRVDVLAYQEHLKAKGKKPAYFMRWARSFFQYIFDHEAIEVNPFILPKTPNPILPASARK